MGAGQSFTLGLRNRDKFAWVGEFSAGAFGQAGFDLEKQVPGFLKDPAAVNKELKLLFLGCGTEDTRYPAHIRMNELLTKTGSTTNFTTVPANTSGASGAIFWRSSCRNCFGARPDTAPSRRFRTAG
jgi:enterochelin esterase-like enzyme